MPGGVCGKKKGVMLLHREILGAVQGDGIVDHIDRDSLNNSRANLRFASIGANCQNSGPTRRNTTGYKGVSHNSNKNDPKQFKANIGYWGVIVFLGYYHTAREAALAYDAKARQFFGPLAYQNIGEKDAHNH